MPQEYNPPAYFEFSSLHLTTVVPRLYSALYSYLTQLGVRFISLHDIIKLTSHRSCIGSLELAIDILRYP